MIRFIIKTDHPLSPDCTISFAKDVGEGSRPGGTCLQQTYQSGEQCCGTKCCEEINCEVCVNSATGTCQSQFGALQNGEECQWDCQCAGNCACGTGGTPGFCNGDCL